MPKRLFIKSWGCQMNSYDSARMAELLDPLGYSQTSSVEGADMVILNTCHIREKASEKLYSELGRLKKIKQNKKENGQKMILAVAGCVAQADGEEMRRRAPWVDMIFGPQTYHRLPEFLAKHQRGSGEPIIDIDFPVEEKFDLLPQSSSPSPVSAFVTIQEGCDKFCSFCVVPYTRGAEFSRPASALLDEVKNRIERGAREIMLLGQNVNAWQGEGADGKIWSFARLCRFLCEKEPRIKRLRYTTSHPADMDADLIAAHGDVPALMPWLHLPVQSGSDRILKAMNRRHNVQDYHDIIDKLRKARSDMSFSSDFIVGFPGESDEDFAKTLKLVHEVGYAQAYSFKYSSRPGTPAAGLEYQIEEPLKKERLLALQQLLDSQQQAFNHKFIGQEIPVLFEKKGRFQGQWVGRTPYMQMVHYESTSNLAGKIADCKISGLSLHGLRAKPDMRQEAFLEPAAASFVSKTEGEQNPR